MYYDVTNNRLTKRPYIPIRIIEKSSFILRGWLVGELIQKKSRWDVVMVGS